MPRQEQSGGDDSQNLQAGRDLTVYVGPTLEEFREVALDVYRSNFLELRGVAEEVALGRAEKITREFFRELQDRRPEALHSAADPDMQRSLYNAQREYACSGEEDLSQVLVDLLVDRAGQTDRGIETVVLNEAINAAPKLTSDQRAALAACFLVRYTRYVGPGTLDDYFKINIEKNLALLATDLPTKVSAYQHIEYVGAGSISMGQISLGESIGSDKGFFTRGFAREEILEPLRDLADDSRVFVPCLRDSGRLQLNMVHAEEAEPLAAAIGRPDLVPTLQQQLNVGAMSGPEVEAELVERVPGVADLVTVWRDSVLKNLTLTTVGIAIGHGYWRRVTGSTAPLSIWL